MTRPARFVCVFFLAPFIISTFAPVALAQTAEQFPIRVDSNLVVARAVVFDRKLDKVTDQERECARSDFVSLYNSDPTVPFIPKVCWENEVLDLSAGEFHVFVEGKEQKIQAVTIENGYLLARDNLGIHKEFSDTPTGIWSMPSMPPPPPRVRSVELSEDYHFYNIAFLPDKSDPVGCHEIKTKVERPHTDIYYRREYCAGQTPYDPLAGTKFGKQMEAELTSGNSGKFAVSLQTGIFYTGKDKARVRISLEFPRDSLAHHWENDWALHATIGTFGTIHRRDGGLATRFSDLACCSEYSSCRVFEMSRLAFDDMYNDPITRPIFGLYEQSCIPTRYETHIDLAPGEYDLEMVLSDGEKFGRVEAHLSIDKWDGKELALSSVMLCKHFRDAQVAAAETAAAVNFAPQYVPLVTKRIQVTPTGDTRFKQGEPLYTYFELYEPQLAGQPTVDAHLRVVNAKTGEVKISVQSLRAESYRNVGNPVIPVGQEIKTDKLPSGQYRLEVQATDSTGKNTLWRAANFPVE